MSCNYLQPFTWFRLTPTTISLPNSRQWSKNYEVENFVKKKNMECERQNIRSNKILRARGRFPQNSSERELETRQGERGRHGENTRSQV